MSNPKIIEKIKKCLRLAKSSNSHEAAAALRQAQALMREHQINDDDVAMSEVSFDSAKGLSKIKPAQWEEYLAWLCGSIFGCKVLFQPAIFFIRHNALWKFIGIGSHGELAKYAFEVLRRQVLSDRKKHIKEKLGHYKSSNKTKQADVYCLAWCDAVRGNLGQFAGIDPRIETYLNQTSPERETLKTRKTVINKQTITSASDGYRDGKNANLHRPINGAKTPKQLEASHAPD